LQRDGALCCVTKTSWTPGSARAPGGTCAPVTRGVEGRAPGQELVKGGWKGFRTQSASLSVAVDVAVDVANAVANADALEVALQAGGGSGGGGGHGGDPFHRGCLSLAAEETKGAVGLHVEFLALPCCSLVLFFGRLQLLITARCCRRRSSSFWHSIKSRRASAMALVILRCSASGVSARLPDAYCVLSPRHPSALFNHSYPDWAILAPSRGLSLYTCTRHRQLPWPW
jgi:hypothetical protein